MYSCLKIRQLSHFPRVLLAFRPFLAHFLSCLLACDVQYPWDMKVRASSSIFVSLFIVALATSLVACHKEPMPTLITNGNAAWGSTGLNNTDVTRVCLNTEIATGPHGPNAPFRTVVWADEFNGPGTEFPKVDPGCYTDDTNARCVDRLDWGSDATNAHCGRYDLTHLRSLNKCAWSLWSGYFFWDGSGKSAASPNQIQMRQDSDINSGVMALRMHVDSSVTGDCIEGSTAGCSFQYGGVDSQARDGMTTGYQVTEGRVEMRAKLPTGQNGYPALWMWQTQASSDGHIGELDLWESPRNFVTPYTLGYAHYHDWFGGSLSGVSSIGFDTLVNVHDGKYHRFGVERTADTIKFYIDDCYTGLVKNGEMSTGRNMAPMKVDSLPEYLMMGMSTTGAGFNDPSSVEGQEMLVDYVRIYGQ